MCKKADQKFSVQTFDQQLYAIAQQIKWANPLEFPDHIIRLGGFHALSCFIASVGKLWGDGGLTDLFVDSGVYAAGTVDQMLSGKQFNRSVRGLTLVYEATMSLWLSSFFDWCGSNGHLENIPDEFWDSLQTCYSSFSDDPPSEKNALADGRILYLAGAFHNPEAVKKIRNDTISDCLCLFSTQEEADTRIILHALHADKQFGNSNVRGRIVIRCSDTDVLVLCVHYFHHLQHTDQLWLLMGTVTSGRDGRRYIPVHDLCSSLSNITCKILPSAHALTGCDTTSSIFGIGKKSVYKLLKTSSEDLSDLMQLAQSDLDVSISASRKLVARLYDPKGKYKSCQNNLNKLRVRLATSKDSALVRLPPSEASFKQHVLRACIQAKVWMTSHEAKRHIGSPYDFG
ncbi:unnamed protein product [Mytilus edulis]|uniref:Uncharacterized protein n=1 Tax=Mytilus edulis TaxID=6550 RepID=A0A8S3THY2_MYTED|nr:unnamed protein product [Mytilus edulis]